MGRTLLIAHPGATWREWLKENRKDRDLVCLDPSDPAQAPPARLAVTRGDKVLYSRFYGSLDAQRAPHVILSALPQMLSHAEDDAIVQLFHYRPTPLMRQVVQLAAEITQPEEIFIAEGTTIDQSGFPVGPAEISVEAAFPEMVQGAQRKAQWLALLENCREHEVDLARVSIEGTRLGSGTRISSEEVQRTGLEGTLYAEVVGPTLMIVAPDEPEESAVARALNLFHASRFAYISTDSYNDLLCSFARQNGEDFGLGVIRSIDFESLTAHILSTAEPPAPVRILRIGALKIDASGRELEELKPWQV